jgi:hypothetical protein
MVMAACIAYANATPEELRVDLSQGRRSLRPSDGSTSVDQPEEES